MEKPIIVDKRPVIMECEAGKYYWCACGKSVKQPFCDGSHNGTGISPVKIEIDEKKTIAWCMCKHTKKPPYCDGTHAEI